MRGPFSDIPTLLEQRIIGFETRAWYLLLALTGLANRWSIVFPCNDGIEQFNG